MVRSILFVCHANICRSPIAEAIASKIARNRGLDLTIDSCGLSSLYAGEMPCNYSVRIAGEHGIDISSMRARQITYKDIDTFELIIAHDDKNRLELMEMGAKNVLKLGAFGYNGGDIPDPHLFPSYEGVDEVYAIIERCVTNLLEELTEK
ncbi:low molecular weight protein-tyrosine-phosphatase [Sulfurimonas sp. HSL3-7]|uniref:low molecular weight protein-tyrosine-phosphatase n=1 Tax=Sulfonitrofixus jiaomeiensis TaxID=3131938 RepID=UPI0031F98F6C